MGRVYRAMQIALNRQVALKVIMPELAYEADFRARFTREAELAASIDHPNIVPVYEAGEADGGCSSRCDGSTAPTCAQSSCARAAGSRPCGRNRRAGRGRARRGSPGRPRAPRREARERDAHLDARPGARLPHGLRVDQAGESVAGADAHGRIRGHPRLHAPGADSGRAARRAYRRLCPRLPALPCAHRTSPYDRNTEIAKMYAHLYDPPPSVLEAAPRTPADLDALVSRALAKQPDERYPSAGDLARAARAALTGGLPSQPERSLATGLGRPGRLRADGARIGANCHGRSAWADRRAGDATADTTDASGPSRRRRPCRAETAGAAAPATTPTPPATPPPEPGPTAMPVETQWAPPAAPPAPPAPPPEARPRRTLGIALGGLLALGAFAAILAVAGVFSGGEQEQPPASATRDDPAEQTPPQRTPPRGWSRPSRPARGRTV